MTLLDDFQGGLDPGWSVATQTFEHEPYIGAAGVDNESAHLYGNSAEAVYDVGAPIETFSFYFRERSDSKGMAITLESSGGQPVVAAGTSNPEWRLNGTQIANPDTYKTWMRVDLEIDPQASEVTATFTNQSYSGGSQTVTKPLLTSTYPTTIRVHASFKGDTSVGSYTDSWVDEIAYTSPVTAPSEASATVESADTLSVSWTNDASQGEHRVELQRDDGDWTDPAGGPSLVAVGSSSADYRPASDAGYGRQVGLDSSFRVRVRHEVGPSKSDWKYSDTVCTKPAPPLDPHVKRPDANKITVEWTNDSDILSKTAVFYRKDTGGGYGSWNWTGEVNNSTTGKGQTASLTFDTSGDDWLVPNARYQFRLRHESTLGTNGRQDSEFVYADYGNANNVYFSDDFSSGDKSAWDSSNGGNVASSGGHADTGVSGPVTGGHYFQGTGSGGTDSTWLQKNLGDLSGETNVHVRCRFAVGSLDSSAENFGIDWYDGSSWRNLEYKHWQYNEQGWFEIHELVPDSWLATDNRIRVGTTTSSGMFGGDYFAVDELIVSDLLHEYTKPAGATNVSASTGSGRHEIDVSWTDNLVDFPEAFYEIRTRVAGTTDTFEKINEPSTVSAATVTPNEGFHATVPRRDGEQYEIRVDALVQQYRRGSVESYPQSQSGTTTATTLLPAPTDLSVGNVASEEADLVWTTNNDYGSLRVDRRPADASSWTTAASGLDLSTESYTLTGLRDGERYDARVVATTEHSETEDV